MSKQETSTQSEIARITDAAVELAKARRAVELTADELEQAQGGVLGTGPLLIGYAPVERPGLAIPL